MTYRDVYFEEWDAVSCAAIVISGDREYQVLIRFVSEDNRRWPDRYRASCNCKGWRMKGLGDCPHIPEVILEWAAKLQGAA